MFLGFCAPGPNSNIPFFRYRCAFHKYYKSGTGFKGPYIHLPFNRRQCRHDGGPFNNSENTSLERCDLCCAWKRWLPRFNSDWSNVTVQDHLSFNYRQCIVFPLHFLACHYNKFLDISGTFFAISMVYHICTTPSIGAVVVVVHQFFVLFVLVCSS